MAGKSLASVLSLTEQRFAIVHATMDVGGAEKQSVILGSLLRKHGAEVRLFSFQGSGALAGLCEHAGLPWTTLDIGWGSNRMQTALQLAKLAWALRRWRPTVLLPYCDMPNIFCGAIWRLTGARLCVWNQRGVDIFLRRSRLAQQVLRGARCILSNSAHRAEYLTRTYGIVSSRIQVVPNGVLVPEVEREPSRVRRQYGIDENSFLCVMVANFIERKNHALLLDAWAKLREIPLPVEPTLLLIGRRDGHFCKLTHTIEALNRAGARVFTLDYQAQVADLVAACDLALFTSTEEGLPNAVLEAMMLAKPVVAVNDPSLLEALGDSESTRQFLAPANDAPALAARIRWAMENPAQLVEAGVRNRRRAIAEFSEEALLRRTLDAIAPHLAK